MKKQNGSHAEQNGAGFVIPESVRQLQLDELPITTRLANIARSIGAKSPGDLNGRCPCKLLQYKDCGVRTLGEVRRLLEGAISTEFDEAQIRQLPDSTGRRGSVDFTRARNRKIIVS